VNPSTVNPSLVRLAVTHPERCRCADPMPVERAERKGVAAVVCQRCGRRTPARLRR
jgi:hypothetical protein